MSTRILMLSRLFVLPVVFGAMCSGAGAPPTTTIASDSGALGGNVALPALPALENRNAVRKQFIVESLDGVRSAQILLFAALRDATRNNDFSFTSWEWLFFNLNGYEWVRRVQDLPLYRRSGFDVDWADAEWTPIEIPEIAHLKEGVNRLTIWNHNPPEKSKDKFLMVAYDNSGTSVNSFSLVSREWSRTDLNGDREGTPQGEWMIRLRLNRLAGAAGRVANVLSPADWEKAQASGVDLLWGFTDSLHHIFPDRSYDGSLRNNWELHAARGEHESCQLVVIPVKRDLQAASVSLGPLKRRDGSVLPAGAATVRLAKSVQANGRQWPDPLPLAGPCNIPRGTVQPFWITAHVPREANPGTYRAAGEIRSARRKPTAFTLKLRVRKFTLPEVSDYAMVVGCGIPCEAESISYAYHMAHGDSARGWPIPRFVLTDEGRVTVDFADSDKQVEDALRAGIRTFSLGRSLVGAGAFSPWCFEEEVRVRGQADTRKIWLCPVDRYAHDRSKDYFESYLQQVCEHLAAKGWTDYFWLYGADEPHGAEWSEPCKEYFGLVKRVAPKLRIMVTIGPTDRLGPNIDTFCIMMNRLGAETWKAAQERNAELWCYSCGDLNNPALTIPHAPITVRLWHWLQEKWNVRRVLLWATTANCDNYENPGADGKGDGQLLWCGKSEGELVWYPSIRLEMLRDGIEDREYFALLREAVAREEKRGKKTPATERARELLIVPNNLVETQFKMTRDPTSVLARRRAMAEAIAALQ